MKLNLITILYGADRYFALARDSMLASLMQPGNIPRLLAEGVDLKLHVYTFEQDVAKVEALITGFPDLGREHVEIHAAELDGEGDMAPRTDFMIRALLDQIARCLAEDRHLIMSFADHVFGDGSLYNIAQMGRHSACCFAAPNLQVDPDGFLPALAENGFPLSNARLATLALRHLHPAWRDAIAGQANANTYVTGLSLQHLSDCEYMVGSRVPNVFCARFNESDLGFFQTYYDYHVWDRIWTSKLVAEQRLKLIGSSNAFLVVEMRPAGQSVGYRKLGSEQTHVYQNVEEFHGYALHNRICGHFTYCVSTDEVVPLRASDGAPAE